MNSVNNKYRYRITSRLGLQQVNPLGEADFTIEWSQEEDEGKLDYKQELPSNIIFRNAPYATLLKLERSIYRCDFIQIAVDRPCDAGPGDTWVEWFNGRMSLNDGEWNLDKCEVKIKLDDIKEEQCFEDNKTKELNLLQSIFARRTVFLNPTNITIETVEYSTTQDLATGDCGSLAWEGEDNPEDGAWSYYYYRYTVNNAEIPAQCEMITRWARETVLVNCGDPAPGAEWVLISDGCPGGQKKYARAARTYGCVYEYPNYGDVIQVTEYECQIVGGGTGIPSIDNGVTLHDVVALFMTTFCPGFTFVSDFFQINPDVPSAVNYVTGQRSKTRFLTLFQKSDVKRPTATGNASKANLSFEKLMEMLVRAYNVRWRVEGTTVRMEHVSYWTRNAGFDLTQPRYAEYVRGMNIYSYNSDDIPAREEFTWMEAGYGDFQGVPILYSGGCVTKGSRSNVKQYAIDKFTTDVELCLSNPDPDSKSVSDDGFALIAADFDGTEYYIITESPIFGGSSLNNSLAWAQLHRDYHKWDRPLSTGSMNSTPTTFFTTKPTKKGEKLRIPLCCTDVFNPDNTIKTPLGIGVVDKATFSFRDETLEIDLLYPADQGLTNNTRPTANNDVATTYQGMGVIINVLANDSDPDAGGVIVAVEIMSAPMNGTATVLPDKTIQYVPGPGYIGDDYFVYRIRDDWNEPSNNALVAITVRPPNQGPNAVNDSYISTMNAVLAVLEPGVFANDTDDVGFTLDTFDTTSAQGGTVSMGSDGSFVYTPPTGFYGTDTFTYTIIDGLGLTDTATVTIDVRNPNNPVANDDNYTTPRNTNLTVAAPGLLGNDTTGIGSLSTIPQTAPTFMGGSVTIGSAGNFTYTPPANYTGPDTFLYTASNGTGTDQATAHINVLPVIYVKLQQVTMTHGQLMQMCGDPPISQDGGDYWEGIFKLFFYSNSAGTIPFDVTGLGLAVNMRITGSPLSGPVYTSDYAETNLSGTEYTLFGGGPWTYYYQEYNCNFTTVMYINESVSVRPGNYIII